MIKNYVDISDYWETVFNTINDGVMVVRPDGSISMVNRAMEKLLGYNPDELNDRSCLLLNCDACEPKTGSCNKWCKLFNDGKTIQKRCLVMKKDRSYVPVFKNASVVSNQHGKIIGAVETFTDLSQIQRLDQELNLLQQKIYTQKGFQGIIGKSASMKKVFDVIAKAANSESPVLITGETGTGKELAAQAIHKLSRRREGQFIQVNCAALNASLLESGLFGHVKGAFTGAFQHRMGRFEHANDGDILLDEIGDVPLPLQVKLLRVLEAKQIERVGDHRPLPVDVRIISATNKNLQHLIAENRFREDLYFRINVIPIHMPPLRDRIDDIPLLVEAILNQLRVTTGKQITSLSRPAFKQIMDYSWPGNVRELKSALEYAFVLKDGGVIEQDDLPDGLFAGRKAVTENHTGLSAIEREEKLTLIQALKQSMGNKSEAARVVGVRRGTVWNRIRKYRIDLRQYLFS